MTSAASLRDRAEHLASTLPPLLVAAERVASTVAVGLHGRRRVGPGETFWQFRRSQPGDPASAIDWRQSAKSDPLYVREREWQAAQSVWLWCDRSPSMRYRSSPDLPEKGERAALLTLALAALLVRGGERIALIDGGGDEARGGGGAGHGALLRLALSLSQPDGGLWQGRALPRHAEVALIGDFLAPLEETGAAVRQLAAAGGRGHLLQVLDPAEETLPFSGRVRFRGLEGEHEVLIARTEDVRGAYLQRMAAQRDGLTALTQAVGWSFAVHRTDAPAEAALLALYAAFSQSARFSARGLW